MWTLEQAPDRDTSFYKYSVHWQRYITRLILEAHVYVLTRMVPIQTGTRSIDRRNKKSSKHQQLVLIQKARYLQPPSLPTESTDCHSLFLALDTTQPVIVDTQTVHHHNTATPTDTILAVPPELLLARLLGLGLAVGQSAVAALGSDH